MRGDKPFAYDLVVTNGHVNSRVGLFLRSIECQPFLSLACPRDTPINLSGLFRELERV